MVGFSFYPKMNCFFTPEKVRIVIFERPMSEVFAGNQNLGMLEKYIPSGCFLFNWISRRRSVN